MKNSILGKARWLREAALATSKNNGARVAREWLKYAAMFVMLFTIGIGNAWGAEDTSEFTSKAFEGLSNSWSKTSSGTLGYDDTRGVQHQKSATTTFTAEGFSNVTKVQVWVAKSSKGAGSVKIQENNTAKKTISSFNTSLTEENYSWATPYTGTLKIVVNATASSIYIKKIVVTTSGGGGCSECTYYVYNGSTWESIGTTGFDDVVLAPPTVPGNAHGAGNGCWTTDKNIFDGGGCTSNINNNNNDYRFVPNPGGAAPTSVNKPGSGTCELYAVYSDNGCLSTTVTAKPCARIWEEPDNLAVSSVSSTGATLSWDAIDGVSSYHVIVTKVSDSSIVFDGNVNGTSKSLTGLTSGTEYSWKVAANSATNDACDSNFSNRDNFTTCASGFTSLTPTVTADKTGKNGGEALFELSGATSYSVTLKNNSTNAVIAGYNNVSNTSGNITFSGLTASTTYRVEVIAHNACGDNSQTGSETFTTDAATLYTVTFVNQSGEAVSPAKQSTEGGSVTLPSASPSVACAALGWTFAGWKDGSAEAETTVTPTLIAAGSYTPSENKTFYAVFTKTEGGGGGVKTTLLSDDFSYITKGTNTTTTGQTTSWNGGTLWTSLTNAYEANGMVKLGGSNATGSFTAKNALNVASGTTITIRLRVKGWSSVEGKIVVSADNGAFDGQSYSYNATMSAKETEEVSSSVVLSKANPTITVATSAKRAFVDEIEIYYGGGGGGTTYWNSNPSCSSDATVTYHNDGAKSGAAPTDANSPYTIGAQVTVLGTGTMVAPDGKEFKCWNTAADGTGTDYNIDAKFEIAANMDFYPKWVNAPYTVRFDAEDGTCGTTSLTEASGGAGVILPAATATCAPAGWSFYGWATSTCSSTTSAPSIVGATGETYYPESDITLHAVYVNSGTYNSNPVCHEVTIGSHTNGTINVNSSTTSPQTVTQGTTVNIAATPESGYNFTGWTITKTTGGNDVTSTLLGANATTASTSFSMPDYDVTVSATFAAKVMYSITWNVNGSTYATGDPSTSAENGTKWSALTLPTAPADNTLSDCDRTKFVGWSTSPLFGEGHSAPSDLFKSTSDDNADSHTITGETTFYAVFAKGSGDGSWVVNGGNLDQTDPQNASTYGKYSGEHTLDGITFNTSDVCTNNGNLQFKASAGTLYNKTAMPADITSIVLSVNTLKVYQNSSVTSSPGALAAITPTGTGPYTYTFTSGNRYFLIKEPDNGASYSTVTVNYEGTGTDYATQCCTLKPVTNLAVSSTTANSVTLTWTAPSPTTGIDHLELRNASTDAKIGSNIAVGTTTTTVGGLTECETYTYKIVSVGDVCETPSNIVQATPFGGSKTVTFNYNGGTGTPASFTTSCGGTSTILPTPTRDGYTFLGWWTTADGGSKVGDAGANYDVATTTTIHAHWAQNFTVTYDLNGGAADPICSGGTYYVGQSVTVCSTTPTKTSSSFLGWKRMDTDATVAGGSTFTMPSKNVTIQAQWETVYFHIYYKEEDGTAIATDDVPQTAETTLRNQTPCVGYTFFGWSTSKIASETTTKPSIIGKGGARYTPDADITVYPVYARSEGATTVKDTLTVANTGVTTSYTPVEGINKDKTPKTIHSNAVYAIGAYNSSGMQFTDGTSSEDQQKSSLITTTSGGSLQAIQARIPYAASTTRYLYTKGNTSDYTMQNRSSQGGTLAWTVTHSTKADKWYSHDFSEDGYSSFFMYCGGGATKVDSIIVTWGTGTYYYATNCETKENVTVTYNGNGGTTTCGDGEHKVTWAYKNGGADAPELENPQTICSAATRDGGYILREWTTGADGTGTHYTPGASITSLANDITLYAQWDRVYTVTFNDQGAITSRTQASGGASVAVPSNPTPCNTKPGVTWTFVGWGSQDGLVQSLNGHIVITEGTSTYTPTDDITLYAVYRKSTGTSDAFAVGTSGAYTIGAKQGAGYAECLATVKSGTGYNCKNDGSEPATIFYLNYINSGEHIGQYTMQDGNTGEYVCYSESGTGLSWSSTTPYYYNVVANGTGWNLQFSTATGRYFTHETGSSAYSFKAYQSTNPVTLHPAAASTYYTVASCDDDFSITFHANGGTITWNMPLHGEGTYQHLADGTEIDVFPTATYDGWTFLGWQSANYDESTTVPEPSTIYGGSDGESGNPFTIHSNTDMYPIFTRFEDNEPFDQINGGDYYIYFLESGSDDGYGGEKRVYAATYDGSLRYSSSAVCDNATTFTFTKLGNGNWTIYDNTTKKYLYGVAGDALKQQASATGAEWTLTVNGNQFDAFHVGTSYGQITAFGDGESATFMNYSRTNIGSIASYHRVYLGGCTNRTFTTYPSTTPNIEIHGQVKVTSTADKSIKAASVLTVSATNIATANLTLTSDNSAFKFSLTSNGTYTASVNIPVVSNKVGVTPIYVEYTPTLTTDGIEEATITVSDGASPTPTTATTESGDVQGRHLPEDFVIAAKIGNNWYALPADCSTSTSSTAGVLIEVDNPSNPTRATGAPMNTKYGLQPVRPGRVGDFGNRLVFTEHLSTQTTDNQKTLYNGAATSIQVNAMYANYIDTNPDQYEWIPTTTDLKDYTLTSAKTFDGDAAARTVSLNTSGVFGTLLLAKAYDGKVRLLPATFYEPAEVQILKWKTNSVIVMYTGTDNATTKVGENAASGSQALGSHKLTHGIYEFTTNEALTANAGQTLRITLGSSRLEVEIPLIIASNTTAAADGKDVVILDGATFTAAATKYNYRNVYVYGGGKLDIPSGTSLGVNNIILRAGGVTTNGSGGNATYAYVYPQVKLVGTLTSTQTNIKYEYVTDYDHWYHLCLPFNALTSTIQYPQEYYGSNVAADNHGSWVIKRYDGATRATGNYDAWVDIESNGEPTPTTVTAGNGYIFWGAPKKVSVGGGAATRQAWGIQRMTMAITAGDAKTAENANKNVTDLAAHSSQAGGVNDQGWNLIGNPYMANLTGLEGTSLKTGKLIKEMVNGKWTGRWESNNDALRYITVPNNNFETYEAVAVAGSGMTLTAGKAFFVQLDGVANAVQFETSKRALAPAWYRNAEAEQPVDVETGIVMSSETLADEVNFWIKEDKSAEYEYNADYPKTPNKTNFNIYGVHQSGNLSWVAISPAIAESDMAIGYQVPAAGDYTLSLSEKYIAEEIESVFVTDHGVSPELTTDLMVNTYTFTVHQAETNNERFTVSIKVREEDNIATDIGNSTVDTHAVKFIRDDKMYILRNGLLYDATGKRVNGINK